MIKSIFDHCFDKVKGLKDANSIRQQIQILSNLYNQRGENLKFDCLHNGMMSTRSYPWACFFDDPSFTNFEFENQTFHSIVSHGKVTLENLIHLPFYVSVLVYTPIGTKTTVAHYFNKIVNPFESNKDKIETHQVYRSKRAYEYTYCPNFVLLFDEARLHGENYATRETCFTKPIGLDKSKTEIHSFQQERIDGKMITLAEIVNKIEVYVESKKGIENHRTHYTINIATCQPLEI